ncbi:MAG: DUF21 domain-containing protein, partial [Myxococcota bacterium]
MAPLEELAPQLAILFALVAASGFFSGSEVAMFSLRRVDREHLAQLGKRSSEAVLRLLERPRRLIATLLIGNECVNVAVATIVASISPLLYGQRGELELALLATFTALPILLLMGEITPKTIAIKSAPSWSRAVARPLRVFSAVVAPVRVVVLLLAGLILRPLGGSTRQGGLR